jgi:uncharacterized protein (UPF0261 family)
MMAIFHGASAAERPRIILQLMIAGTACVKMRVARYELQQDVTAGHATGASLLRCPQGGRAEGYMTASNY